jgi:hypothetical protein
VSIAGASDGTVVTGNLIGTDATGNNPIPNRAGVVASFFPQLGSPTNTQVGGTDVGEANTIAHNETAGVIVGYEVSGVVISANSIFDNGELGIDLLSGAGGQGVTPNDAGDADVGGNGLQNFPIVEEATSGASMTIVRGTLSSVAGQAFVIEAFANPSCDPSGNGEGRLFIGLTSVTTDGAGEATFTIESQLSVAEGWVVVATARQAAIGNTSEFGPCHSVESLVCPADYDGDGFVTGLDYDLFVQAFEAGETTADFDEDGFITGQDFDLYVAAYEEGC